MQSSLVRQKYSAQSLEGLVGGRRASGEPISVREFSSACIQWAELYYRKRGKETRYASEIRQVLRRLTEIYGDRLTSDVDQVCIKAVRQSWILDGCARTGVNHYAQTLRLALKWGVGEGLVPNSTLAAAQSVRTLARGRTEVHERPRVLPVVDQVIEATVPFMPPTAAAIIRLMRLTAMRPAEACELTPSRLTTKGEVWLYEIPDFKSSHIEGIAPREVALGPKSQEVLRPFIARITRWTSPLFHTRHGTPMTPGMLWRQVQRASRAAGVPEWFPYQIRHTRLTEVRHALGIEAAQAVAGHARISMTEHYAAKNRALMITAARATG